MTTCSAKVMAKGKTILDCALDSNHQTALRDHWSKALDVFWHQNTKPTPLQNTRGGTKAALAAAAFTGPFRYEEDL